MLSSRLSILDPFEANKEHITQTTIAKTNKRLLILKHIAMTVYHTL